MNPLDRFFGITQQNSTISREVLGGLTTFATMSYIVFVQPSVLQACGMDFGSVLMATCLASAFACLMMGLVARYPFAQAPGMGENFLFAFTVCGAAAFGGMEFSWQAGLAIVLISGLIFLVLTLFGVRRKVLDVLPDCLKNAIGPGIGMFIAYVGLQWGGIIVSSQATMTTLVATTDLPKGPALITAAGVLLIAALMALRFKGAILVGILACTALGYFTGVFPQTGRSASLSFETFFQLDFGELVTRWDEALLAIAVFFFLDLFDTVGTLVGVSSQAGFLDEQGRLPRSERAFFCDAAASCVGALFGTSTVTSYIESATGVAVGARTGLAAVVTGICFVFAIALAPVAWIVGQDVGPAFYGVAPTELHVAMHPAVAPALIVVGFLMLRPLTRVAWDDVTEGLPAFATVAVMVFGYGIAEGIAAGCISFALVKTATARFREVHPVMYVIAALLILRYAFLM